MRWSYRRSILFLFSHWSLGGLLAPRTFWFLLLVDASPLRVGTSALVDLAATSSSASLFAWCCFKTQWCWNAQGTVRAQELADNLGVTAEEVKRADRHCNRQIDVCWVLLSHRTGLYPPGFHSEMVLLGNLPLIAIGRRQSWSPDQQFELMLEGKSK